MTAMSRVIWKNTWENKDLFWGFSTPWQPKIGLNMQQEAIFNPPYPKRKSILTILHIKFNWAAHCLN